MIQPYTFDRFPKWLKEKGRFVLYKLRGENSGPQKSIGGRGRSPKCKYYIPNRPTKRARLSDEFTWGTLSEAEDAYLKSKVDSPYVGFSGIALVLTRELGVNALILRNAFFPDSGKVDFSIPYTLKEADAYAEAVGHDVLILAKGDLLKDRSRDNLFDLVSYGEPIAVPVTGRMLWRGKKGNRTGAFTEITQRLLQQPPRDPPWHAPLQIKHKPGHLLSQHLDDLRKSGLSDETIKEAKIYSAENDVYIERMLRHGNVPGPAMVMPYLFPDGSIGSQVRLKPDKPRLANGHPIKYEAPKDTPSRLYFPLRTYPALWQPEFTLCITEGEKKALAVTQAGLACIGLSGVWNGFVPRIGKEDRLLIDDFDRIELQDRLVLIIFDTDGRANPSVLQARSELAALLNARGANVEVIDLPLGTRGPSGIPEKQGVDDFIVAHGERELIQFLSQQIAAPEKLTLNNYREVMAENRERVTTSDEKVFLDTSPTGSGKSYQNINTIANFSKTLTVFYSHNNCREAAREYEKTELDVGLYPERNSETCRNLEEARRGYSVGISVTGAVCPTCHFKHDCSYLNDLEQAKAASHRIGTHRRFSLSSEFAKEAELIVVEEDPLNMLRPVTIVNDLESLEIISRAAGVGIAAVTGEDNEERLRPFFERVVTVGKLFQKCLREEPVTKAISVPGKAVSSSPKIDSHFYRELGGQSIPEDQRNALYLCMGIASGRISELAVHVAEQHDGNKVRRIIGVEKVEVPASAKILITDATADLNELESVLRKKVVDLTPSGCIDHCHGVLQYPEDVTKSSGPSTALQKLRSVMAQYPEAQKFGILTHQKFVPHIDGTAQDGPHLEQHLRDRIVKIGHFRGTDSRASNEWYKSCDRIIILGTPRVPREAVTARLLQRRDSAALHRTLKYQDEYWSGRTVTGRLRTVHTWAYADWDHRSAHEQLVKAELQQCLGRARTRLETGVPVVVVSVEKLGIQLADEPLPTITDRIMEVIQILGNLEILKDDGTVESPIETAAVAERLGISQARARKLLNGLVASGHVEKVGERKGWVLTDLGRAILAPPTDAPQTRINATLLYTCYYVQSAIALASSRSELLGGGNTIWDADQIAKTAWCLPRVVRNPTSC